MKKNGKNLKSVALSNISVHLPLTVYSSILFPQISSFLIWVFYVPSQLLLALSGNSKITKVTFN